MGLEPPPAEGSTPLPAGCFDGHTVIVTGGGTGIGKGIAIEFGRLGANVAIVSRKPEHLAAGVAAVSAAGGRAQSFACDIRDEHAIATMFDQVTDAFGAPGTLVNNAAGNFPVASESLSANGWRAVTDIVMNGTFFCSTEFGRRRMAAGEGGSIINIGASYAWTAAPGFVHSGAAKAGVKAMTETLAIEWAPDGIRVNHVIPGLFPHDDETKFIKATPGRGGNEGANAPAQRTGFVREMGWMVAFLASPWASYVTGATITVDGGNWFRRHLMPPPFVPIRDLLGDPDARRAGQA